MNENYKGSIELISGLKQKNNLDFPLMEASAVAFYEEVQEGDSTVVKEIRLPEKLKSVGISEKDKQTLIETAVTQVLDSDSFTGLETNVKKHGESIGLIEADIDALERQLAAQAGDNDKLIVHYDKVAQKLYLYEKDEKGEVEFDPGTGEIIKVSIISETTIQGGGGSTGTGATYSLSLKVAENTKDYFSVLEGRQALLSYEAKLVEKITDPITGETSFNPITAEKITYSIYHNDVFQRSVTENEVKNGTIDVTDLLVLGNNNFKITGSVVEYIDTKNDEGEDITVAIPARATARWTVNVVSLRLELPEVSDSGTGTVGWDATPKFGATPFTYKVVGALPKKIYFILDGDEEHAHIETVNATELSSTYTIPKQTHGIHTLEVYCEGTLEDEIIPTDRVKYVIMFVESGNVTPLIRLKASNTAEQYSNTIVYFNVYDPLDDTANKVEIYENDELKSTYTNIISSEQNWTYNPQTPGLKTIKVKYLEYEESIDINVNEFPYKVSPAEGDLMVDFTPRGRSNQDIDYNVFKNNAFTTEEDGTKVEIPMNWTFSDNFDWINGGWQKDSAGDEFFCIKAGTSVNFDYNLFDKENTVAQKDAYGNYSIAGTGKEFKLIFKTANVARADATWLSCMSNAENGQPTGIEMQAHNAYVKSNFDTLEIPYSEEDIIEFDMNIVPITKFTATYEPEVTSKVIPMIMTYEDGTPVQPKVITNPATSFKQTSAVPISIGSEYCDVHIYRLKVYERYLSESEILNNFIADARNGEEMAKRFKRNQIYMTGQSSFGGTEQDLITLAEACPDLRVYLLSAPYFTNHKDDKVKGTTIKQWYYKNGKDSINDIWVATGATHRGQGTSSNEYGYSGRNLDFDMKKAEITLGDNKTKVSKISLTPTSVPTNYLNYKTNIASSEHANNALLQKRFDRYLPYETLAAQLGAAKGQDVKNSMEFYNCVVFIQETDPDLSKHREFNDTKIHFYGIGNIGDSKKTDSSRLNDKNDTKEFCVEIMDWNRHLSNFPVDTMMNAMGYKTDEATQEKIYTWAKDENLGILYELIDGEYQLTKDKTVNLQKTYYIDILEHDDFSEDYTYGFRYITEYEVEDADKLEEGETIEGNKQRNKEVQDAARKVWQDFYRFITRDLTTDGKEDSAKVAAWKSEFADWFILDAALYYYLFTLRYTMVDNRAKNSFWHYGKCPDGKYRFEFWDYDNDTALGIDNAGKLEIPFGIEDNDTDAAGAPYFRANDSTFFSRVAKYFTNELNTMWTNVEQNTAKGNAFDSTNFINEFDAWQEQFPEELWRLDYERKYKRTYVGGEGSDWDGALPKIVDGKKVVEKRYLTEMMNGRKKYQRRQFERNQDAYMSSKFFGTKNYSNSITLRGSGASTNHVIPADFTLRVIPFTNMYLNLHDGTNYFYHNRVYAGQEYVINLLDSIAKLDLMYIRGASNLQDLGDLSLMYLQTATLGAGSKLKRAILGNPAIGYSNAALQTLEVGASNQMLEDLDIRNLSNLTSTDLPVTSIPSLKRVYAQGSNILTARFANNGLLEEAYLPATLTQLELRNLYFLKHLELEGYSNLIDLTIDNCNISSEKQVEMLKATIDPTTNKTSLKNLRITNVDWTFENTDELLNHLVKINSIITGTVRVGSIRESEIEIFNNKWGTEEFHLIYNEEDVIPQYQVRFWREKGASDSEPIYTTLFDEMHQLTKEDDPSARLIEQGLLVKEQTAQYVFTFDKWSPNFIGTYVQNDLDFYGTFKETIRTYNVAWYNDTNGNIITNGTDKAMVNVEYGQPAVYDMDKFGLPIKNTASADNKYHLFKEWNVATGYITGDTKVYPVWETSTANIDESLSSEELSAIQLYALSNLTFEAGLDKFIADGAPIKMQLGYMPDYNGITLVDSPITFDGTGSTILDTEYKLFDEDKNFTLAIDFTTGYSSTGKDNTLVSCGGVGSGLSGRGFRLYSPYTSQGYGLPVVQWNADQSKAVSTHAPISPSQVYRDICVIRHIKGDPNLYIYTNNRYSFEDVKELIAESTATSLATPTLCFGAQNNASGVKSNYGTGIIHYAKLWFDDLGADECKKICAWTRDELTFRRCGTETYWLPDSENKSAVSFIADKLLEEPFVFDTDVKSFKGGWDVSQLRSWLNNKVFAGLSLPWQQLITPVVIKSLYGSTNAISHANENGRVLETTDKLYIPAYAEIDSNAALDAIYGKEASSANLYSPIDTAEEKKKTYPNNQAGFWWTRTPQKTSDKQVVVNKNGVIANSYWEQLPDGSYLSYNYLKNEKHGVLLAFSIGRI